MSKSRQPSSTGLTYLYLTQTLSGFGFYGIKSIFVLYAINQLALDKSQAITLFATFMTLCYATSLIGGTLADRILGVKNAILIGGFFSFAGLFCFAFPSQEACFMGLSLMSLGSGFFKPNLSTAVGLYFDDPKDPEKDRAYSLFYVVLNLGNLLAPLICGYVSSRYGWNYGILLIAASFLAATYIFNQNIHFTSQQKSISKVSYRNTILMIFLQIILLGLFYLLFKYNDYFHSLMGIIASASFLYLGKIVYDCNPLERKDVFHIIFFIVLFSFFCSLFEQAGSSLILFFENGVSRDFFGLSINPAAFLSLNPIFVLILGPILITLSKYSLKGTQPLDELLKITIGFIFVGFSFLTLSFSTYLETTLVSPGWVIGSSLLQTIGELLIVPILLSTISKFSPLRFRSVLMSFGLMAIAYGHYFAGFIAQFSIGQPLESTTSAMERYGTFFLSLGIMPLCVAFLLLSYQGFRVYKNRINNNS